MLGIPLFKSIAALMVVDFALSQTPDINITASTCADPGGYTACLQPATVVGTKCAAQASDPSSLLACACDEAIAEIACALAHCWNVVRLFGILLTAGGHANMFRRSMDVNTKVLPVRS